MDPKLPISETGSPNSSMRNEDLVEVFTTVLRLANETPLQRRARLYRGLAGICGDSQEEATLRAMADELTRADEHCRAFEFSFVQKNKDGGGK